MCYMNTKHYLLLIEPRYLPLYFCCLIRRWLVLPYINEWSCICSSAKCQYQLVYNLTVIKSDHILKSLKHFLLTAIVHSHPEILAVIDFNNVQNQPEGVQVNAYTVL